MPWHIILPLCHLNLVPACVLVFAGIFSCGVSDLEYCGKQMGFSGFMIDVIVGAHVKKYF